MLHGLFAGIPDRFRSPGGLEQRIEDLEDERRGYLVLIFSDGKGLGPAAAGFALERLARWPQVAWMQLQGRRFWDRTAARPALHGLPVFPADRKGLLQVVAAFAMERAVREPASSPESWRGLAPRPLGGSLKLRVEEILGDSLLWAQACAMAPPPISLGLADRLRERFHPGLPPDRIERLIALPGSRLIAGGLKLDQPVLAVLREGFAERHGDQEAVLELLLEQMGKAEPEERDSLAHQAWEWRLERIRLELDPEPAVERLAALALGPMREAIRADLGKVWSRRPGEARLPLRIRPRSRYAAERLGALTGGREISTQDLYRPRVWPEAGLAMAAVALVALLLWRGALPAPAPRGVSLLLTRNTPDLTDTAQVKIEQRLGNDWVAVAAEKLDRTAVLSPLYVDSGEFRISAFLPGGGLTRKTLTVSSPGTFTVELATERQVRPCRKEFPELDLVVTRCLPKRLLYSSTPSYPVPREPLSPKRWIARIGIDLTPGTSSSFGTFLLKSGSIDVMYSMSVRRSIPIFWIRQHWQPWADQVLVFAWTTSENVPETFFTGSLADWSLPPAPPSNPVPAEPKQSGAVGEVAETETPGVAPPQETAAPGSRVAEKPTTTEVPGLVIENLPDSQETPAAVDQPPPCPNPALIRCGDACVDLRTNPFHNGACFTIAPSLGRAAAMGAGSPPSWTDERIQRRRFYRVFYTWDASNSSVTGRSLPSQSDWNRGEAPDFVQLPTLSAAEVAGTGYALAITDLEIHCTGSARVANVNSEAREMYERLSTRSTWRPFGRQAWRGPDGTSTNTELNRILATTLATWEQLCKREP